MTSAKQPIILITGGSGYLGRHVTVAAASNWQVVTTYGSRVQRIAAGTSYQLDITNADQTRRLFEQLSPEAIVHCVAANPGSDEATMMSINGTGSGNVARAAAAVGARLVHVSTDLVHDGANSPYPDETAPTPTSLYGRSKALAEALVAEAHPSAAIVRTSLIYGLQEMDRGTAGFVARLKANQPLILFRDVVRQPVWVDTLCRALLKLSLENRNFAGIINVVGRQALDRETFGRKMLAWWQVDSDPLVQSGLGADLPDPPPLDIRLKVEKGEALLAMPFLGVDEVLQQHQV